MDGYRRYKEETGEDADDVKDAPTISQFTADIWEAWRYLTGSRQYTMGGAAPIAISEILAYAEYKRIASDEDRDRLLQLITAMDVVYLEQTNTKEGA